MATSTPNLDTMTKAEISERMNRLVCGSPEYRLYSRAWSRAGVREHDALIYGLPEDALVKLSDAAHFLYISSTAMLPWVHKGKLTGTKKPRGARGFLWLVPVTEIKRLRIEQDARITRERAWMQEPAGTSSAAMTSAPTPAETVDTISAQEFVGMWGSDPAEDARKAAEKRRRWWNSLKVQDERDDEEED